MPCVTKKFDEPICSYTRASSELRKAWLSLFKEKYYWRPEYESRIKKNFNKKGSEGLSRALSSARKNKQRPEWIILPIWVQLLEQWRDGKFISKCNTNKKTRTLMWAWRCTRGDLSPSQSTADDMRKSIKKQHPQKKYFC
ncbi:unnamed protein product [Cuscuta europaea]|uniref:Uncharacterized protein n=1 Tax=Cuscuta europaea TaxID=41803 RepID=A0A9P1EGE9_CUSEU|nr:unnamed protein product [Cuscuta europaea]